MRYDDHHELLGIDKLEGGIDSIIDFSQQKSAIRIRSGGRAATFLTNNGEYTFEDSKSSSEPVPLFKAGMLDVKGIGTHVKCEITNKKNTGLLNYADALRELGLQRLIQRLAENENSSWATTQFYAIIDTGMTYVGENPATGWKDEKCVLAVRQRQTRAFVNYGGYNFSGVLQMTGEEAPAHSMLNGFAREVRCVLTKSGVSSEFEPRQVFHRANGQDPTSEEALDDIDGTWNLQADAALSHLMDFSDYFVLPDSPIPDFWKMSEKAFSNAFILERPQHMEHVMECPPLRARIFGTNDKNEAQTEYKRKLAELSTIPKIVEGAGKLIEDPETGQQIIQPAPPKY